MNKHCSIDGCGKTVFARGWCSSHYKRWFRHGAPTAGSTYKGALKSFLAQAAEHKDKAKCLIWPFGDAGNGYGKIKSGGKREFAHRAICEMVHGSPPTSKHYAAHSCGNGHLGCVNPHHLLWKTPTENSADQKLHGTVNRGERNGSAKLSLDQVIEIRELSGSLSQADLGAMYGVSRATVSDIQSRRRWAWLDTPTT